MALEEEKNRSMYAGTCIMWIVMDSENVSVNNQPLTVSVDALKDLRIEGHSATSSSGIKRTLRLPQATVTAGTGEQVGTHRST
jgi:hypothetical protein